MQAANTHSMHATAMVDPLTERSIDFLQNLLKRTLPPSTPVYLYGSRAKQTHRWNSDFDLWIDAPIMRKVVADLEDAIDESIVPFHVDIVTSPLKAGLFEREVRLGAVRWI